MTDCVRRKLGCDHEVDRPSVGLVEIEQPPQECLAQDALARVPLVGHRYQVDVVVPRAELGDEVIGEDLGAAVLERHLRRADCDPHRAASRCTRVCTGNPTSRPVADEANEEKRARV